MATASDSDNDDDDDDREAAKIPIKVPKINEKKEPQAVKQPKADKNSDDDKLDNKEKNITCVTPSTVLSKPIFHLKSIFNY
jgi:hypothetical protein